MGFLRADSVATREPLVRLFHGSLVMAFTTAYVGGEAEALDLHALAGWRSRRPPAWPPTARKSTRRTAGRTAARIE